MYSVRKWLNKSDVSSTGSVVAFYGPMPSYGPDPAIEPVFELADCHGKVRLHMAKADSMESYIAKIRIVAEEAAKFADFLEHEAEED